MTANEGPHRGPFRLPAAVEKAYQDDEERRDKCGREDYLSGYRAGLREAIRQIRIWLDQQAALP